MRLTNRVQRLEQANTDPASKIAIGVPAYDGTGRLVAYQIQGQRVERTGGETEEAFGNRVRAMRLAEYTVLFQDWQTAL